MRRFLILFILTVNSFAHSQISSLADLATGEMEMFSPIYEENRNVFGYFALFKLDKLSKYEEKYEYVILDKNLNKVANGEFVDISYKGLSDTYYVPDKVGNHLILTKGFSNPSASIVFTSSRLLSLEDNSITKPFYFDDNVFFEGSRPIENIKKKQRKVQFFNYPLGVNNGYVVVNMKKTTSKVNPTFISFYNLKHEKIWDYNFQGNASNSEYQLVSFQDNMLYFTLTKREFNQSNIRLIKIDSDTGEAKFSYTLEDSNAPYNYNYKVTKIEEKTIITGKISPYSTFGYSSKKAVGLFKIVLDEKGNERFKKHFLWEDANAYIDLNKKGKLDEGYKLGVHSYFVFNDERIVVLAEKFKESYNLLFGDIVKTTDFVILQFDRDFNIIAVEAIEKDLSKFSVSDYLFSQYLNDKKDAVFFYRDYKKDSETKEKNWVLGIVSLVNGEIKHENIPMSSDDFFIYPYIAKEGYILLREFNKNSDYDSIRLEKLNLN